MVLLAGAVSALTWRHDGTDTMTLTDEGNLYVLGNVTASWFDGIFNWIVGSSSTNYLSFNGTQLDFNETQLNQTITLVVGEEYIRRDGTNNFTANFDAGAIN